MRNYKLNYKLMMTKINEPKNVIIKRSHALHSLLKMWLNKNMNGKVVMPLYLYLYVARPSHLGQIDHFQYDQL